MPIGKTTQPRWKYDFDCHKCGNVKEIHNESKKRHGNYCVAAIERYDNGLSGPIHADEDRVIRCDCFVRK